MSYRVGIDIGGTFTDFALLKDGEVVVEKTLSTPGDRSHAVMTGLEKLATREGLGLREFLTKVEAIIHGTTIADNTLIEMNGAVTGLLTDRGVPRRDRASARLQRGHLGRPPRVAASDRSSAAAAHGARTGPLRRVDLPQAR